MKIHQAAHYTIKNEPLSLCKKKLNKSFTYCSQLLDHMNLRIVLRRTGCSTTIYLENIIFSFLIVFYYSCHFMINSIALFAIVYRKKKVVKKKLTNRSCSHHSNISFLWCHRYCCGLFRNLYLN